MDDEPSKGLDDLEELMQEYEDKSENAHQTNDVSEMGAADIFLKNDVVTNDKQNLIENLSKSVVYNSSNKDASGDDADNTRKRLPVWVDSDDDDLQLGEVKRPTKRNRSLKHMRLDKTYKDYLTSRYTKIVSQPKWSTINQNQLEDKPDSDDGLQRAVGFLNKKSGGHGLRQNHLQFKPLKDLNRATYAERPITSIQFHPTNAAALVTGENGVASIYCVDGQQNEKLHNMHFKGFKITCAKITPCGTKAFFGSLRPVYYVYDLISAQETKLKLPRQMPSFHRFRVSPCGRYIACVGTHGAIHLLTANTNELIHTFKQNEMSTDMCFTGDSHRLISNGKSNNVSIFSLRQQRMEHSFVDDGCIKGKVLDLAPNQRLLATGSSEGVVNVYDYEKVLMSKNPLPEKSFMNLTTEISHIRFNHSSEILAMCSKSAPCAVKLAHFPSATVFANFPDPRSKMGNVKIVEFSPMSGYLAMGNNFTKASLLRLKYFKNY